MMNSPTYVIEVPSCGNSNIRPLTEAEQISMGAMDIEGFTYWTYGGGRRFWAYTYSEEQIRRHGFSMTDNYSKEHGFHVTDFVALGNGIYEYYEEGFDHADALIRKHGSFSYFLPEYSWGSNGCQLLSPISDLTSLIPSCFVDLISRKGLVALAVTSDVDAFLYGYLGVANGVGGEDVKTKATRMGLIRANDGSCRY